MRLFKLHITQAFFILTALLFACSGGKSHISHYVTGKGPAVASGDSLSTSIGLDIMNNGGNAADAAAAVILSLTVTDSKDLCFGGEASVLVYDPVNKNTDAISAIGRAPLDTTAIHWYMENGIPSTDIRSAPVPAIPGLIITLLRQYGTLSFAEIAQPVLQILKKNTEPWHAALSLTIEKLIEAENKFPGDRMAGLGAVNDRFYRGDIADSLVDWYQRSGGFLKKEDLMRHITIIEKPVSINYHGFMIYKCGPWTQGPVLLEALKILDAGNPGSTFEKKMQLIHEAVESMKLAMADRDEYFGDPQWVDVPLEKLLSIQYARLRSAMIDPGKASIHAIPGDPRGLKSLKKLKPFESWQAGTTTCCIIDKNGLMIAATPSGWGSEAGAGGSTGIWHSTRLRSFNTSPGHPNCIAPGKRPRVTLTPTLVLKDEKPYAVIAVAGGDVQDQVTYNLLLNLIILKMTARDAMTAPRFITNLRQDSFNPSPDRSKALPQEIVLSVSAETPDAEIQILLGKNHKVVKQEILGEPVMIIINQENGITETITDMKTNHFGGINTQ